MYVDGECWNAVLAAQLNYPIFNAPPSASMQTLRQLLALKALSRGITGMAMPTTKKIRIPWSFCDRSKLVNKYENACRATLNHLKDAVESWNSVGVDFALSLGDVIDGQNSGTYGQGNYNLSL